MSDWNPRIILLEKHEALMREKDAEIERLRDHVKFLNSFRPDAELAKRDAEIERLRGLVDACAIYLKEDETPAQRIERERADTDAVLKILLKEKREVERLRQIIHDLDEHEGAEGWSEELHKRIDEALGERDE